jgi:hypothetical protein
MRYLMLLLFTFTMSSIQAHEPLNNDQSSSIDKPGYCPCGCRCEKSCDCGCKETKQCSCTEAHKNNINLSR